MRRPVRSERRWSLNSYYHAVSSARKFGGRPEDYQAIHDWFDATKAHYADWRHRALRHHSLGIFDCEALFGHALTTSEGRVVPVRLIGEQHVTEDCGFIPTVAQWLSHLGDPAPWMLRVGMKAAENGLDQHEGAVRRVCQTHVIDMES